MYNERLFHVYQLLKFSYKKCTKKTLSSIELFPIDANLHCNQEKRAPTFKNGLPLRDYRLLCDTTDGYLKHRLYRRHIEEPHHNESSHHHLLRLHISSISQRGGKTPSRRGSAKVIDKFAVVYERAHW